jgi:hypothetical protein
MAGIHLPLLLRAYPGYLHVERDGALVVELLAATHAPHAELADA